MEIVNLPFHDDLDFRLAYVNQAAEDTLAADIATWETIRDKHLKVKGGSDGVDLDNGRKRAAIRERCKLRLLMEDSGSGITRIVRA